MKTASDPRVLPEAYVQHFLNDRKPMEPFTVIFKKVSTGEQRKFTCYLDPNGTVKKKAVPVMTKDGWRSFRIDSVLSIGPADIIDLDW